jgi:lysophospholipase L1-like esterase
MMNISTTQKTDAEVPRVSAGQIKAAPAGGVGPLLLLTVGMVFAVVCAMATLEFLVFPSMEDQRKLGAAGWAKENEKLFKENSWRNWASKEKPLWTSSLYPVDKVCSKQKRILVLGDSYVWGDGYANLNDIWWRQLARELDRRGYDSVEIIAAGYPGASTKEELKYAESLVPEYNPDLIVWGYAGDDPDEGLVRQVFLPPEPLFDRTCALLSRVCPNTATVVKTWRSRQRMLDLSGAKYGFDYSTWEAKLLEGENFQRYKQTVARVGQFQREHHIPIVAITLPNSPSASYFKARYPQAQALFEANGIPFCDTTDALVSACGAGARERPVALTVNPLNGHPGPAETHVFAVEAANVLEQKFASSLGPRCTVQSPVRARINDAVPPALMEVKEIAAGVVEFNYPAGNEYALNMPLRKAYAQFDLELPAKVSQIRLSGAGLKGAALYTTHVPEQLGYDDGDIQVLPWQKGASLQWDLTGDSKLRLPLNTVRVVAKTDSQNRRLKLQLLQP